MAGTNPGSTISKWTGGVNSLVPPDCIGVTQYAWGINIVNRGGIIQTRPGFDYISTIQGKKPQGSIIFRPKSSRPMMLVAVDGEIWQASLPFKTFSKISGLKFRADTPFITFTVTLKNADFKADQSVEIVDPVILVIIQDGRTIPAEFDGVTAKHNENIKIGLWSAFVSSALWVFDGSRGYVSDLASPNTFFSGAYIAERANFDLPGDVTGVIQTSDEKSLLVFTETTTTAFQSNIRDRKLWQTTPDFQKLILPSIGCVSGRSPVNQYGLTWWMSHAGFINLDAALQSKQTSKLVTVDGRMMRSKRLLAHDLSGSASTYFENYLLLSVPSGSRYNNETWVGDQAPQGEADGGGMAWVGVWTGVRPVQWMRTTFCGKEHLFFLAFDESSKNGSQIHVWEAFQADRRDNDARIPCQLETGMMMGTDLSRFQYAEIDVTELLGDVELRVFVGGVRGEWHQVKYTTLQAEIGILGSAALPLIEVTSILQGFKPQSRFVKTEEFSTQGRPCGAESSDTPGKDKGFQLLLEWRGRMGIKAIKFVINPDTSANRGECKDGEVGSHNMVTEEGVTITA
jgi:hypothetical protein